jgi:NAD-dependent dihydropyrimidine dehydrogenase PreA subunit
MWFRDMGILWVPDFESLKRAIETDAQVDEIFVVAPGSQTIWAFARLPAMRVIVDWDLCESNAQCVRTCPEIFFVNDEDRLVIRPTA